MLVRFVATTVTLPTILVSSEGIYYYVGKICSHYSNLAYYVVPGAEIDDGRYMDNMDG